MSDQFFDEDIDIEWILYEYLRRIGLDIEPPERKVRKSEHPRDNEEIARAVSTNRD